MAGDIRLITGTISDAASFQAWGGAIHSMLTTAGLVQTGDSGQVDVTTMTIPGTNNTSAGYRMYKLNDSHDATTPVYLRVEFMRGANVTSARVDFYVGRGSDGAGVLVDSTALVSGATVGVQVCFCTVSHTYGMFAVRVGNAFVLAHRFGTAGNPELSTSAGFVVARQTSAATTMLASSCGAATGLTTVNAGLWGTPHPAAASSTATKGAALRVARCWGWNYATQELLPLGGVYGRHRGDFAEHVSFDWAPNGVDAHGWLPVGSSANRPTVADYANAGLGALLVVWD